MKIINHKYSNSFPPKEGASANMLRKIADKDPNYAFVIEWGSDGKEPIAHTTTEDLPVLAYRLQNILNDIYSGKIKLKIADYEKPKRAKISRQ